MHVRAAARLTCSSSVDIEELPNDDPLIQAMERLARQDDEKNDD